MRFMKVPVDELEGMGAELVAARGPAFNKGVVFKEWEELAKVQTRGDCVTNEWRLFFGDGMLLGRPNPNSFQPHTSAAPPEGMVRRAAEAARSLGSPYVSIDIAQTASGGWICLEAGDIGASGPGVYQNLEQLWHALKQRFVDQTL